MTERALALGIVLALLGGCRADGVRVRLEARAPAGGDGTRLEIRAQVAGPQRGLHYRWLSVAGECEPQETTAPATVFHFAEGTRKDRVTVEVWRDSARVAEGDVDVQVDARRVRVLAEQRPAVTIAVTQVPPYEPNGGPDTRADIGGAVSGDLPPDYEVLVYAFADAWYIQPLPNTAHAVGPDRTWRTWTHTGSSYAAPACAAARRRTRGSTCCRRSAAT